MKGVSKFFCMSLLAALGACGRPPIPDDVVGTWVNPDGATLTLEQDGHFTAHALPSAIFIFPTQVGRISEAEGVWRLTKGKPYWEVKLRYGEVLGHPLAIEITVLVSGSGDSTYLYEWEGDADGGKRYKLERKPLRSK